MGSFLRKGDGVFADVLLAFGSGLVLSLSGAPVFRFLALRWGVLSYPNPLIESHVRPIPYLGGAAVFLGCLPLGVWWVWTYSWGRALWIGGAAVLLLGLADDLHPLSPWQKLLGQGVAAVLSVGLGLRCAGIGNVYLASVWTVLWLVGVSNALNLIDMMDGLSSGIGAIASMGFALLGAMQGHYAMVLLGCALAGALIGFLRYNFHPARMFMGDMGSLFIGFMLGGMGVVVANEWGGLDGHVITSLVLGIPLFELVFVAIMRIQHGRPLFLASRDHFAQRMLRLGLSIRQVVGTAYAAGIMLTLIALGVASLSPLWIWISAVGVSIGAVVWGERLSKIDMG